MLKLGGSNFWRDEYLVLPIEWKVMLSPGLNCVSLDLCKDINLDLDTRFNPDESAPSLLYRHMRQSINTYTIPSVCADSHAIFMHIQARMLSWALSYISFLYHIALIDHTVKSQAPWFILILLSLSWSSLWYLTLVMNLFVIHLPSMDGSTLCRLSISRLGAWWNRSTSGIHAYYSALYAAAILQRTDKPLLICPKLLQLSKQAFMYWAHQVSDLITTTRSQWRIQQPSSFMV